MKAWGAEYRRWSGESTSVWRRRAVIAGYGLRLCLSGKIVRILLGLVIFQGAVMAALFFVFGQLSAYDSLLMRWIESVGGPQVTTILQGLSAWALLYPEICVDGVYRVVYYAFVSNALFFSWILVTLFCHRLMALDLASNAIVIYRSKALSSFDYLLGKFGVVFGILCAVWVAPVALSWLAGNALSPDWSFFRHSLPSLGRGLGVGLVAAFSLSCLALGVSALTRRTGTAVACWALGWIALNIAGGAAAHAHPALRYLSPSEAISAIARTAFDLPGLLRDARDMLPFFDSFVNRALAADVDQAQEAAQQFFSGGGMAPGISLILFSGASLAWVAWKARSA